MPTPLPRPRARPGGLLVALALSLALAGAMPAACSIAGRRPGPGAGGEGARPEMLRASSPPALSEQGPCPQEMASLDGGALCVDRWEAHVLVASGSGDLLVHPGNEPVDGLAGFRAASAAGVVPQGYISGEQAQQACRAAGKRLCSAPEWRRACEGPARTPFPYGPSRVDGACNDRRFPHPFVDVFGDNRPRLFDRAHLNDPRLDALPRSVLPSGSMPGCVSPEGVHDMVGNLHEWIDDPGGTFVGGYFVEAEVHGLGCRYVTTAHSFDYHDYSTGFRCCRDPGP